MLLCDVCEDVLVRKRNKISSSSEMSCHVCKGEEKKRREKKHKKHHKKHKKHHHHKKH